jgi:hypothetical protein
MREIRNSDGRLVCRINERTGEVEIQVKGCVTLIRRTDGGEIKIVNTRKTA